MRSMSVACNELVKCMVRQMVDDIAIMAVSNTGIFAADDLTVDAFDHVEYQCDSKRTRPGAIM